MEPNKDGKVIDKVDSISSFPIPNDVSDIDVVGSGTNNTIEDDAKEYFRNREYETVTMNQGKKVTRKEGDPEKSIFTYGLGGCTATGIHVTRIDGTHEIIICHYDPTKKINHSQNIQSLIGSENTIKSISGLILSPGEYEKNDKGEWILKIKDNSYKDLLEMTLKSYGEKVHKIDKVGYSEVMEFRSREEYSNRFWSKEGILELNINTSGNVNYSCRHDKGTL